jgi:hypothetical protein
LVTLVGSLIVYTLPSKEKPFPSYIGWPTFCGGFGFWFGFGFGFVFGFVFGFGLLPPDRLALLPYTVLALPQNEKIGKVKFSIIVLTTNLIRFNKNKNIEQV